MSFIVIGRRSAGEHPHAEGEYPLRLISRRKSDTDPTPILDWSDIKNVKKEEKLDS